jgi:predicted nucleic acid-binding protein
MLTRNPSLPQVFIDADVLFAGSASPSEFGASLVVLRMAEITLINAVTSQQVITEAERNLAQKLPAALPAFQLLVQRSLVVVPDPGPADLTDYLGLADEKDLPVLAAALREKCGWLVTFNIRHFQPGHSDIAILKPGACLTEVRYLLSRLR